MTIGVANYYPSSGSATLCRGAAPSTGTALDFADSGFDATCKIPPTKPQQVVMKAVRKMTPPECVPGFADVSKSVSFSGTGVNPNAEMHFGSNPDRRSIRCNRH